MVTCATEGYQPNTKVALANLRPCGASVVRTWCDDEGRKPRRGALPFRTASFDLVIDRHEPYLPEEVFRVLKKGGQFVTQQVGERNNVELRRLFGVPDRFWSDRFGGWNLTRATDELLKAGFRVKEKRESIVRSRFLDVGAIVYHLRVVPWDVPDFTVSRFEKELRKAHSAIVENGSFDVTTSRFYLIATKE
jgi:SAM-dependent methyltransferase